jgi:predicted dehydrogenase
MNTPHPHRHRQGPVTLAVVGAGSRGHAYAAFAREFPDRCRIVAVAEPRDTWRDRLVKGHDIPADQVFTSWEELAACPRLADAVIISTQDHLHRAPVEALAPLGYHILLEKPMAPSEEDCVAVAEAVRREGVIMGVCHVLLYTAYTRAVREVLQSGRLGRLISVQRLEPVGYWHQAHSFVRGNWRNEEESSFMLLSKSIHDLDWLRHIVGRECRRTASFGGLGHFQPGDAPDGAGERCLECEVETHCPYSAKRFYLDQLDRPGRAGWARIIAGEPTPEAVTRALRDGPYGRCVYRCDNDVVDHQVVMLEFDDGATASFTMTAFTEAGDRKDRIFGTRASLEGDGESLKIFDFLTDETETIPIVDPFEDVEKSGHGGGDFGVMDAFVRAVAEEDRSHIFSGVEESLASHRMVFAAERARRERTVVEVPRGA